MDSGGRKRLSACHFCSAVWVCYILFIFCTTSAKSNSQARLTYALNVPPPQRNWCRNTLNYHHYNYTTLGDDIRLSSANDAQSGHFNEILWSWLHRPKSVERVKLFVPCSLCITPIELSLSLSSGRSYLNWLRAPSSKIALVSLNYPLLFWACCE